MLNCSLVWVVWESSQRLATFCRSCRLLFQCPNDEQSEQQQEPRPKVKTSASYRFLLEIRDHKHGDLMVSLRTRALCADLKWWKWTCSGLSAVFLFLDLYLLFLPLSLSCVPVRVCVGLRASVRVSHRWVLPGKVQTGHARAWSEALVFLGRHGWVSSTHARTHTHELRGTSEALLQP